LDGVSNASKTSGNSYHFIIFIWVTIWLIIW
jgi:hypothetical protein